MLRTRLGRSLPELAPPPRRWSKRLALFSPPRPWPPPPPPVRLFPRPRPPRRAPAAAPRSPPRSSWTVPSLLFLRPRRPRRRRRGRLFSPSPSPSPVDSLGSEASPRGSSLPLSSCRTSRRSSSSASVSAGFTAGAFAVEVLRLGVSATGSSSRTFSTSSSAGFRRRADFFRRAGLGFSSASAGPPSDSSKITSEASSFAAPAVSFVSSSFLTRRRRVVPEVERGLLATIKSVPNSERRYCQVAKQATAGFLSGAPKQREGTDESEVDLGQIAQCSDASRAH